MSEKNADKENKIPKILTGVKYGLLVASLASILVNPTMACYWLLFAFFISFELYQHNKNQ